MHVWFEIREVMMIELGILTEVSMVAYESFLGGQWSHIDDSHNTGWTNDDCYLRHERLLWSCED